MDLTNLNKDRKTRRKPSLDFGNMVFGKVPPQAKELVPLERLAASDL